MLKYKLIALLVLAVLSTSCEDSSADGWFSGVEGCGNGSIGVFEVCDRQALAGMSCQDFGYPAGQLRCNSDCRGYLVGACEGIPTWAEVPPCAECEEGEVCQDDVCVAEPPRGDFNTQQQQSYDIRTATVSGIVSRDRSADPDSGVSERVVFHNVDNGQEFSATVGPYGRYNVQMYADYTYRVFWARSETAEPEAPEAPHYFPQLPRKSRAYLNLAPFTVDVTQDRRVDLEVPRPVELSGTLRVVGSDKRASGVLELSSVDEEPVSDVEHLPSSFSAAVPIDTADDADFSMRVYPGTYRLAFRPGYEGELSDYEFAEHVLVEADTVKNLEIPMATLRGYLDVPDLLRIRVSAGLYSTTGNGQYDLGRVGSFDIEVPHGTYSFQVRFLTNGWGSHLLEYQREIIVDGDTRVELRPNSDYIEVTGTVSGLGGLELSDRSNIRFASRTDRFRSHYTEVQPEDGTFTIRILPGDYFVYLYPPYDYDLKYSPEILVGNVTVEEGKHLELETRPSHESVRLEGELTENGRPIPEILEEPPSESHTFVRGYVDFICIDEPPCQNHYRVAIPARGPARYEADVLPGVTYRVELVVEEFIRDTGPRTADSWNVSPLILGRHVLQPELVVERGHRRDFDIKTVSKEARITANGQLLPANIETNLRWERGLVSTGGRKQAVELPTRGPAIYEDEFYPGYHQQELSLPFDYWSNSLWSNHFIDTSYAGTHEFSLPLRKSRVRLTHNGVSIQSDADVGDVFFETPWGTTKATVNGSGVADIWWFGEDPTVTFRASEDSPFPPHRARLVLQD